MYFIVNNLLSLGWTVPVFLDPRKILPVLVFWKQKKISRKNIGQKIRESRRCDLRRYLRTSGMILKSC